MASSELPADMMMPKMNTVENHLPANNRPDFMPGQPLPNSSYAHAMMPSFPTPLYISNQQPHQLNDSNQTNPYTNIPDEYKHYNRTSPASSVGVVGASNSDSHNLDNLDQSLKSLIQAQTNQNSETESESDVTDEDNSAQMPATKQFDPIRNLMPMRQHTKWTLQQQKRNTEAMNSHSPMHDGSSEQPAEHHPPPQHPQEQHQNQQQRAVPPPQQNVFSRPYLRENQTDSNNIEAIVNEYLSGGRSPTQDDQNSEGSLPPGASQSEADDEEDIREEDLEEELKMDGEMGTMGGADRADGQAQCEDCLQVFRSRTLLIYHQRKNWHGGLEPYMCQECGQEFGVKSHLRSHQATHSSIKPFQCPVKGCERTFARVDQVNNHLRLRHRTLSKVRRKDYYQGMPYVEAPVSNHNNKVSNRTPGGSTDITCEDCGKSFKNRTLFYYHQHKNSHGGKVPYLCTVCNATFGVRTHLKLHMRKHTKERPYQCPVATCGRFFSRIDAVNIHLKNVHNHAAKVGAKDYRNVPTDNSIQLVNPILPPVPPVNQEYHVSGRGYSCSDCDAAYRTKALLDYHQRKLGHGGMQPFTCPICGAGFGHRSHLRGHLRKHTRARPFFCPVTGCTKRFSRVDIVNVHLRRVHKETLKVTMKDYVGLDLDGPDAQAIMRTTQLGMNALAPIKIEDTEPMSGLSPGNTGPSADNPASDANNMNNAPGGFNPAMNLLLPSALNNVSLQLPATAMLSSLGMRPSMPPSTQANYMCNLCQKPFTDLISLQAHMRQHGTPKLYLCPVPGCGKYLSRVGIVNNHLQAIHGLNIRVSAWDYKSQRIPMFDPAKQMNANQQQHQQQQQNNSILSPNILGGQGLDKVTLEPVLASPNNAEHSALQMLALPPEKFSILGSKFHKKFAMAGQHLTDVTIVRRRRAKMSFKNKSIWCKCQLCSYETSTKTMMILHQRQHKGLNRFCCKHCGVRFGLKGIFYRHVIKCASKHQPAPTLRKQHSDRNVNESLSPPHLTPFSPLDQHHHPQHSQITEASSKYFQPSFPMNSQHQQQHQPPNHPSVICSPPSHSLQNRGGARTSAEVPSSHTAEMRHDAVHDQSQMSATSAPTSDLTSTYLKMLPYDTSKNSSVKVNPAPQGQSTNHSAGMEVHPQNPYGAHNSQFPTPGGPFLPGLQNPAMLGGFPPSTSTAPLGGHMNAGMMPGMSDLGAAMQDASQKQQAPLPNIEAVAKYIKDRLPTASMYASVAQTILSCTQTYANNNTPNSRTQTVPHADTQVTFANRNGNSPIRAMNSESMFGDVQDPNHGSSRQTNDTTFPDSQLDQQRPAEVSSDAPMSPNPSHTMTHQSPGSSASYTGLKDGQTPFASPEDKSGAQNDSFGSPKLPSFSQIKTEPLPSSSAMGWGMSGLGVGGMGMAASMYQNLMYPMLAAAWGNSAYTPPGGEGMNDRNSLFALQSSQSQAMECTYKCPDCGEAFRTKPLLVYHQRKNNHGGLHGFTCGDCGATFGTRCHLESHSRKHTKERPFTCPLCSSAYSRVDIVNVHLKTVHRSPLKVRASDYSRSKFQGDL